MNNKEKFLERAKEFFSENEGVNKVYFTSDGNMFRAEHYADNWKVNLTDKTVTPITEAEANGEKVETVPEAGGNKEAGANSQDANKAAAATGLSDEDKAALKTRYIELFDKKPVGMSYGKIAEAVKQKEQEANN